MNQQSDITEQYLNKCFDDFSKEQMRLLNEMKGATDDSKDKDVQKQLTLLNTLVSACLRLRNLKKALIAKSNL
jgi:polyhydroxyalkanoate synthesis regulator protein